MLEHDMAPNPDQPGPFPDSVRAQTGPNPDQSETGPDSCRTGTPLYRVRSGAAADDLSALARWRDSQRHAEAEADWSQIELVWAWLEMSDEEQRVICTATHFHDGPCPKQPPPTVGNPPPRHYCHRKSCPARHHRPEETMTTRTKPASVGVVRTPRHLYYFNGAGPWPGVTTVTDVLDKPALLRWHKEQVARAALAAAERLIADRDAGNDDAAVAYLLAARNEGTNGRERGSRIHAVLEAILRREPVEVEPVDMPAVAGARAWLNEAGVKPLEVEAFLINETLGYGGTCDLVAEIAGEVWLLDWKTSKSVAWPSGKVYDEMRLQLAAYGNAEFIARPADPQRYEVPAITRHGVVHVTDAGTRLYDAEVSDEDWIAFRAALRLYQWRGKGRAA